MVARGSLHGGVDRVNSRRSVRTYVRRSPYQPVNPSTRQPTHPPTHPHYHLKNPIYAHYHLMMPNHAVNPPYQLNNPIHPHPISPPYQLNNLSTHLLNPPPTIHKYITSTRLDSDRHQIVAINPPSNPPSNPPYNTLLAH